MLKNYLYLPQRSHYKEIIKSKAKDSEIVEDPICLGNISKDFSERNMKKTGLYDSVLLL